MFLIGVDSLLWATCAPTRVSRPACRSQETRPGPGVVLGCFGFKFLSKQDCHIPPAFEMAQCLFSFSKVPAVQCVFVQVGPNMGGFPFGFPFNPLKKGTLPMFVVLAWASRAGLGPPACLRERAKITSRGGTSIEFRIEQLELLRNILRHSAKQDTSQILQVNQPDLTFSFSLLGPFLVMAPRG